MQVSLVSKNVHYACGCLCTYELIGFMNGREWKIIPCKDHAKEIEETQKQAETDYLNVTRQFLTEHDCIGYLRERGYAILTPNSTAQENRNE